MSETLTPSQVRFREERKARLARMQAHAVPDIPIRCVSASERSKSFGVAQPASNDNSAPSSSCQDYFSACFEAWLQRWNIREYEQQATRFEPMVGRIQNVVSEKFGLDRIEMKSIRRTRNVVRARQIAMYLTKTLTVRSLPDIGRRFGGRDHTTVLHAIRKVEALMAEDPVLVDAIAEMKVEILRNP